MKNYSKPTNLTCDPNVIKQNCKDLKSSIPNLINAMLKKDKPAQIQEASGDKIYDCSGLN